MKREKERVQVDDCMQFDHCIVAIIAQLKKNKKYPAAYTYRSTLNSFREFSGGEEAEMPVDEVFTPGRLKEYETWLRQKGLEWNTVSTYMRTLRAVYNRICPPWSADYNPTLFDHVYTKVESNVKRAITREQLQALYYSDFASLSREMQEALAYFLLMFLLRGMPFIDLAHLRKQDFKGNCIIYRRHKTGRQITVSIPRKARKLFEKFRNKQPHSTYLFPILTDDATTEEEMYAQYRKALRRFNKQLEMLATLLPTDAKLSSYTARHTWATVAYHMEVAPGIISQALGHSSVRVTETYLKPFEYEKVDAVNEALIAKVLKPDKKKKGGAVGVQAGLVRV